MPSVENQDSNTNVDEAHWTCIKCNEDVAQGDLHECPVEDEERDAIS